MRWTSIARYEHFCQIFEDFCFRMEVAVEFRLLIAALIIRK